MALTIDGSDPSGDLGDLLDDKLDVATAVSDYLPIATAVSDYLPIAGGKVLQVVRATDTTQRTTTSTSYVDVTGITVTITPQKSTSAILLITSTRMQAPGSAFVFFQITDASNNTISGAEETAIGASNSNDFQGPYQLIGYATPATTSPVTYKMRFKSSNGSTAFVFNQSMTGQMYAIEVSA